MDKLNINNDGTYMYGFKLGTDISTIKKDIIDNSLQFNVSECLFLVFFVCFISILLICNLCGLTDQVTIHT